MLMCVFIVNQLQIIRRNMRLARRGLKIQQLIIPNTAKRRYFAVNKTIKQVRRKRKFAMEFERRLIIQSRQALRHHNLSMFIARHIDDIVEQIQKSQQLIVEYYDMRCESDRKLTNRIWRLETYKS